MPNQQKITYSFSILHEFHLIHFHFLLHFHSYNYISLNSHFRQLYMLTISDIYMCIYIFVSNEILFFQLEFELNYSSKWLLFSFHICKYTYGWSIEMEIFEKGAEIEEISVFTISRDRQKMSQCIWLHNANRECEEECQWAWLRAPWTNGNNYHFFFIGKRMYTVWPVCNSNNE